jgi:hypothetical protein
VHFKKQIIKISPKLAKMTKYSKEWLKPHGNKMCIIIYTEIVCQTRRKRFQIYLGSCTWYKILSKGSFNFLDQLVYIVSLSRDRICVPAYGVFVGF